MTFRPRSKGAGLRPAALAGLVALLVCPTLLAGQSEELSRVDRLLDEGRFAEARSALEGWLNEDWDAASRGDRQHGLWLRAVLTIDPGMAELDLRRLVVEYPGGRFSDEALLRLAHAARMRGENGTAAEYLEILVRDYPESPNRVEARALLSRLREAPAEREPVSRLDADRPPPEPRVAESGDPDPRDAAGRDGRPPEPPISEAEGMFTVQLGAFSTEARALTLALEMREAGFDGDLEPRVVRLEGSELARVRAGVFPTREEAQAAALRLRDEGFDAMVASDRLREVPDR